MQLTKTKTKRQNLLDNADNIIEMISNNNSYRVIANKYDVEVAEIFWFVNHSEHSARAKQALQVASYDLLDKAQQAIESIEDESTNARVARQRELKNIYLYRAQIKNRKELDLHYREEKQDTNQQIIVIPANFAKNKDVKTIENQE